LLPFGVPESQERLNTVTHVFTHYRLRIVPVLVTLARRTPLAADGRYTWLDVARIAEAALPAPVKKLLVELLGATAQGRMF
jgi:A/G-specific adenine glycosylase